MNARYCFVCDRNIRNYKLHESTNRHNKLMQLTPEARKILLDYNLKRRQKIRQKKIDAGIIIEDNKESDIDSNDMGQNLVNSINE